MGKPGEDARQTESRLILARAAREGDLAGGTVMPGAELDAPDRIEVLGMKIAKVLSIVLTVAIILWLAWPLLAGRI
ncbi:MAG: hypothetical protein WAT78_16685 [Rhizobiaceae bacterium]